MHPVLQKKRKSALIIGWVLVGLGVCGILLPFLQGLILVAAGVSILSAHLASFRDLRIVLIQQFPGTMAAVLRIEAKALRVLQFGLHTRQYESIRSRQGMTINLLIDRADLDIGTAVVLHSASGYKESPVSEIVTDRCRERGYAVVRFDATHGIGSSSGEFALFRASGYVDDLEDVLAWVKAQAWYRAPLILIGHSVGALVAGSYANRQPHEVAELVYIAPTISGSLYREAYAQHDPDGLSAWEKTGLRTVEDPRTGVRRGISYGFIEDLMKFDLTADDAIASVPVHILSGADDRTTPVAHVERLREHIVARGGTSVTVRLIPGFPHTPTQKSHFRALREALSAWGNNPHEV